MNKYLTFEQKINDLSVKINFKLGTITIKNKDLVSNFSMKGYSPEFDKLTLIKHFYSKLNTFNADEETKNSFISILQASI